MTVSFPLSEMFPRLSEIVDPASIRTVVTHGRCSDGDTAAYLCRLSLPSHVRYLPLVHSEVAKLEPEPGMMFIDITPEHRTEEFAKAGAVVLDHHKGVEHLVRIFGSRGVFADRYHHPGISGAVLAHKVVYQDSWWNRSILNPDRTAARELAELVGIVDTWVKDDPRFTIGEAVITGIGVMYPRLRTTISPRKLLSDLLEIGTPLLESRQQRVTEALRSTVRVEVGSLTALLTPRVAVRSELAELLRQRNDPSDVLIAWDLDYEDGAAKMKLGLRSIKKGFNCVPLAKFFGGNGHEAAAGGVIVGPDVESKHPIQTITDRLQTYYDTRASD